MADEEYYDVGYGRGKKKFEMTIPVLLLILVFFVVAWKLGWLTGLPVLGDLFKGGTAKILVVGSDSDITTSLDQFRTELSLNYDTIDMQTATSIRSPDYLNQYNLIILTEGLSSDPKVLPSLFRGYLKDYLAKGGDMILFGLAGSRDTDLNMNGWDDSELGAYIPVKCKTIDNLCNDDQMILRGINTLSMKIYPDGMNHAIMQGYNIGIGFTGDAATSTLEFADVNYLPGTKRITSIEDSSTGTELSYPAIVEKSGLTSKVIYFAYHPSRTPTIFKNTIKYIM